MWDDKVVMIDEMFNGMEEAAGRAVDESNIAYNTPIKVLCLFETDGKAGHISNMTTEAIAHLKATCDELDLPAYMFGFDCREDHFDAVQADIEAQQQHEDDQRAVNET